MLFVVGHDIQVAHDLLRAVVPQKNFSLAGLDTNSAIAPHVRALVADAANAVSAECAPPVNGVTLNVRCRNRSQPEA